MYPSILKGTGSCPFLPPMKDRLDESFNVHEGLKEFLRCVSVSRNLHTIGFKDPSLGDCTEEFVYVCKCALGNIDSREHLERKRRCIYDITSHPWEFQSRFIEILKSEGRYTEKNSKSFPP